MEYRSRRATELEDAERSPAGRGWRKWLVRLVVVLFLAGVGTALGAWWGMMPPSGRRGSLIRRNYIDNPERAKRRMQIGAIVGTITAAIWVMKTIREGENQ